MARSTLAVLAKAVSGDLSCLSPSTQTSTESSSNGYGQNVPESLVSLRGLLCSSYPKKNDNPENENEERVSFLHYLLIMPARLYELKTVLSHQKLATQK